MKKIRLLLLIKQLERAWKKGDSHKENKLCQKIDKYIAFKTFTSKDWVIWDCGTGEQIIDLLKAKGGLK